MGYLGYTLSRRAGTGYSELVRRAITTPLHMGETDMRLSTGQRARFVQGYLGIGSSAAPVLMPPWDMDDRAVLAGAGALRSSVTDLLTFLRANPSPPPGRLGDAIRLSHEPLTDAPHGRVAMGWHIDGGDGTYWHTGATYGFQSYIGMRKKERCGVVLLSNTLLMSTGSGGQPQLGLRLLEAGRRILSSACR